MSKRSKRKQPNVVPVQPVRNEIEAGMQNLQKILDATKKGYERGFNEGYELGRQEGSDFAAFAMCPAFALALNDLYGFGKIRSTRALNLAGEYMLKAFTTRELIEEAYKRLGFEFADDPLTGHMVEVCE